MQIGTVLSGASVPANTYITANGTGTGNAGTYILNNSASISTEAMNGAVMSPASAFLSPTTSYR